ncbi:MAG: DUF4469 domain-containing protein [Paludibacteraceae bacterium]
MATTENTQLIVELFDLAITEQKDDRFGRKITIGSENIDSLVKIAVTRRTDLNPETIRTAFILLKDIAIERLLAGASVNFGLGHFNLGVNGVFMGDNAQWDSTKHSLSVTISPTAELRDAVRSVKVNVRGMATTGTVINTVTDVASGEINTRLTPGGGVNVTGSKIKVAGDNPACGIILINEDNGTKTTVPANAIAVNNPSKITFVAPAALPAGNYKLSICTQFSNTSTLLKEPREYVFDYTLTA